MPRIELIHRQSATTLNPLGIKGVGESGVIPAPAAIVSAIEDALAPFRVRVDRIPIAPPELLALIKAGGAGSPR
jgi:carbon-monoxide dehydrogenase large subunit